jgi:hypothetical protein
LPAKFGHFPFRDVDGFVTVGLTANDGAPIGQGQSRFANREHRLKELLSCRSMCAESGRFFRLKCLTEPLQEIFSRQGAKRAKKKIFSYISKLGVLCVFARVIILQRFATDNFKYVWLVFTPESLNCSRFYHRSYSGQMLLNPILVKAIAIAPQGFFSCCS